MKRHAFTLIEMLTSIAVLVIVLGLMVGLARRVRETSSQALTKNLLRQLDAAMTEYVERSERGAGGSTGVGHVPMPVLTLPAVAPFPPPLVVAAAAVEAQAAGQPPADAPRKVDRGQLLEAATANSRDLVKALQRQPDLSESVLAGLPASIFDREVLRDAWGSPIVFMPSKHPWVGTAPRDKGYFFFSAGPDRDYLTPVDNLYSYEELGARPSPPAFGE